MNTIRLTMSIAILGFAALAAASELAPKPVPLNTLSAFKDPGENWKLASALAGDPRRTESFDALPGAGILANVAPNKEGQDLFTNWEHGDIELELDFLLPKGSNSGIYLQSRYEVQLIDSWGATELKHGDCGGIYQRYIEETKQGYEGTAPSVNACRAPGLWQHIRIVFQAPRFDSKGKKTENARFSQVSLNGTLIHENIEVTGPTRGASSNDEIALAPLRIQGNHGPIAFRNISIKLFGPEKVGIADLSLEIRKGETLHIGGYDQQAPDKTLDVTTIDLADVGETNKFAATYKGKFQIPTTGTYAFYADAQGPTQLIIDGKQAITPLSPGGRTLPIELEAGDHAFRLDYTHPRWGKAGLVLSAEGPGIQETPFAAPVKTSKKASKPKANKQELIIEPQDDRVRVQRGFIPHVPLKKLYALAVGSPNQIHYAYDLDTATILHAWNGPFLDTFEMWDGRGSRQVAKPAGPTLTFLSKPPVSLLQFTHGDFPDEPDQLWKPKGYTLDPNGQPEFHASLAGIQISDRIVATNDKRGLKRTLTLTGSHTSWWTGVLLAEADSITPQGENSYFIGDREYYIDVDSENKVVPFLRNINGHDQLIIWAPKHAAETTLTYSLVW